LITARYFSSCPSDSTSRWTPCPPESYQLLSGQRGITPAFGYGAPHPGAKGTLTLLNNVLLSTHYEPLRHLPPPTPSLTGEALVPSTPLPHGCRLLLLRTTLIPCVLSSLPRWNRRLLFSFASPATSAFLVIMASRLPHRHFRGLLDVHSRYGPHGPLILQEDLFLKCFKPFVAS
jgi:hypothetical protein